MDLVDEQHVARLQIGQQRGEIAGALDHRARGGAEADPQLARDDLRQRRLAEAGRPEEQHVVERLASRLCAASMKTARLSRTCRWPTNSSSASGRIDASGASPVIGSRRDHRCARVLSRRPALQPLGQAPAARRDQRLDLGVRRRAGAPPRRPRRRPRRGR